MRRSKASPLLFPVPGRWVSLWTHRVARVSSFFFISVSLSVFLSTYLSSISWPSTNKTLHMYGLFFFYINRVTAVWHRLAWVGRLVKFSLALLDCRGFPWRFGKVRHIIKHSLLKAPDYSSSWLCPDLALHGPFSSGTLPQGHTPLLPDPCTLDLPSPRALYHANGRPTASVSCDSLH